MKPLVKITENIVQKKLSKLGAVQTHILLNWNYIAEHYSNITIPDKIKFNTKKNTDGQITIKVQNGFGPEIQHAIPFLLNQINSRFGYKAITKIKIIQSELGYIKKLEKKVFQQEVFTNDTVLISNILPDGELKLAMQRYEISRKKML